jgi:hypothetical protein
MNIDQIRKFFDHQVKYKDWSFCIGQKGDAMYLQIQFNAPDNFSGKIECQHCRKWQLSEWMTETELVQTAWAAVQRAELHEAAENFKFMGQDIFNTHLDARWLASLCQAGKYEHRPEPEKFPTPIVPDGTFFLKDIGKDVHTEHCCVIHGCKYADDNCSVTMGKSKQSFPCESCENESVYDRSERAMDKLAPMGGL